MVLDFRWRQTFERSIIFSRMEYILPRVDFLYFTKT